MIKRRNKEGDDMIRLVDLNEDYVTIINRVDGVVTIPNSEDGRHVLEDFHLLPNDLLHDVMDVFGEEATVEDPIIEPPQGEEEE